MDKNAIKKYAVWARRELISRVSQRAALYEITDKDYGDASADSVLGRVMSAEEKHQRQALIAQIREKGYEQVMEEIAYTWFNRFIALRFMEVNGYLPSRVRVFTDDENKMEDFDTSFSVREIIKDKLRQNFDGKIVRKDLTKKIKEGANVPTYVLEFLLGQYCSSDDDEIVAQGVENVKRILADNYVRPDESEKVLSKLRQRGAMTIIDQVTVELNLRYDYYEARFSNLGLGGVPISEEYPEKFDRLLCGGIWCIIQLEYNSDSLEEESQIGFNGKPKSKSKNGRNSLISIRKLTPIQMPHVDIEDLKQGRKALDLRDQCWRLYWFQHKIRNRICQCNGKRNPVSGRIRNAWIEEKESG